MKVEVALIGMGSKFIYEVEQVYRVQGIGLKWLLSRDIKPSKIQKRVKASMEDYIKKHPYARLRIRKTKCS